MDQECRGKFKEGLKFINAKLQKLHRVGDSRSHLSFLLIYKKACFLLREGEYKEAI